MQVVYCRSVSFCQENQIGCCCRCVPAMPTGADNICSVSNVAQWDDADPVQQNWVTEAAFWFPWQVTRKSWCTTVNALTGKLKL